jgi:hypothetical protein
MRIRIPFCVATAVALALATAHLSAHDFWLGASNWTPDAGMPFSISAGVGEHFPKREDFKTPANWFDDWRIIGPSGAVPVSRVFERRDLAMVADVTLPATGAFLAVLRVTPRIIQMKADEFNKEMGADIYPMTKFKRSNQNTCINQKPIVRVGQKVHKGQVLAVLEAGERSLRARGERIPVES